MNKRRRRRVPLKLAGRIDHGEQNPVNSQTRDLSAIGAFFDSVDGIPVGSDVDMEIFLPLEKMKDVKRSGASMKVSGTVVRVQDGGVAVLFKGLKVLVSKKDE